MRRAITLATLALAFGPLVGHLVFFTTILGLDALRGTPGLAGIVADAGLLLDGALIALAYVVGLPAAFFATVMIILAEIPITRPRPRLLIAPFLGALAAMPLYLILPFDKPFAAALIAGAAAALACSALATLLAPSPPRPPPAHSPP